MEVSEEDGESVATGEAEVAEESEESEESGRSE
jgi:hypothetical protein